MRHTVQVAFIVALAFGIVPLAFGSPASANWFNKSEQYLAACQNEAARRYYKDTSSEDVRRHIYMCMGGTLLTALINTFQRASSEAMR